MVMLIYMIYMFFPMVTCYSIYSYIYTKIDTHDYIMVIYIYDLPVSLSQVTEDGYMYRSKCILTKNIHQNHPAAIPQGLIQQLWRWPSSSALREHPRWFRIACLMESSWSERWYSLGVKTLSSGLGSWLYHLLFV